MPAQQQAVTLAVIFDPNMQELLDNLKLLISQSGGKAFFNDPASIKEIDSLCKKIKIQLPDNLKQFYLTFNGGFIADDRWTRVDLSNPDKYDFIKWNSNTFFSLDMIGDQFSNPDSVISYQNEGSPKGISFFPFLQTQDQETYVIKISSKNTNRPVFHMFRESEPKYWPILSQDFSEFLRTYIAKKGNVLDR